MKNNKWVSLRARLISEYAGRKNPESAIRYLVQKSVKKLTDIKNYPPFLPADFIKIYEEIEIREVYDSYYDAKLIPKERGFIVEINNRLKPINEGRYNFCFYHEIGHSFFFECDCKLAEKEVVEHRECEINEMNEEDEEEYLCNIAATEFLMPKKQFVEIAQSYEPSIASVKRLAKKFGTSILATIVRIISLKVWECVAVKYALTNQSNFERGFKDVRKFYSDDSLGGKIDPILLFDCLLKNSSEQSRLDKTDLFDRPKKFDLIASLEGENDSCAIVRPSWKDIGIRIESERFFNEGSPYFISLISNE